MAMKKNMRLISYSQEIINGEPIYVSTNCFPVKALHYEPAGLAFHVAALKLTGLQEEESNKASEEDTKNDKTCSDGSSRESKKSKKNLEGQQNHYSLLGLGHLRYLATEDQIKKSYREAALLNHPDKQASILLGLKTEGEKQRKKDEIEDHFRAIQTAYEVLVDPSKRRLYDSEIADETDDKVPVNCSRKDFFDVFGPYFVRNGHWSTIKPVPMLGDENTPLEEVDKFYAFWYNFKSWRESKHKDEHDPEDAESREEKRWMERQNAKLREGARKEEYARIRNLVDNAHKKDPRILDRKEREKAEKRKKKDAKFLSKRLEEEAAARAAEEERIRREEDERIAAEAALNHKKMREKEKKLLRKERSRLRGVTAIVVSKQELGVSLDDVENLCMSLDIDKLRVLCDILEGKEMVERARFLRDVIGGKESLEKHDQEKKQNENGYVKDPNSFVENGKSAEPNGTHVTTKLESRSKSTIGANGKVDLDNHNQEKNLKENGYANSFAINGKTGKSNGSHAKTRHESGSKSMSNPNGKISKENGQVFKGNGEKSRLVC